MAQGGLNLQAADGKIARLGFEDGASGNVAVIVPKEGGVLATEDAAVLNTGNETIAGVKTFSSSPIVPNATADYQVANKKYVDDSITGLQKMQLMTEVATTSGTAIYFTGETVEVELTEEDLASLPTKEELEAINKEINRQAVLLQISELEASQLKLS